MNDISDFIQSYWFELGSLTAQFAILAVLVWYGRARLRMLAGSEREVRPAPKPADAATVVVRLDPKVEPEPEPVRETSFGRSSWPVAEPSTVALPSIAPTAHTTVEAPREAAVSAPPERKRSGPGPVRAIVNWLRAPVHTRARKPRRVAAAPEPVRAARQHVMTPAMAMSMVQPAEAEACAAGHGGVGRMLSPVPEAIAQQTEAVVHRPVKRNGPIRGLINWLRAPMYSRAVPRHAARQ